MKVQLLGFGEKIKLNLVPESDQDRVILEALEVGDRLVGMGRDPETRKMIHAQVPLFRGARKMFAKVGDVEDE